MVAMIILVIFLIKILIIHRFSGNDNLHFTTPRYSPLTLLAILDPNAGWLSNWLHLHLSRSLLLSRYSIRCSSIKILNCCFRKKWKTSCYRLGKARKILQEMLTAVNTFLKDKSFTYFEEVKADFHMFKSQRVFNLVSSKV